MDKQDVIVMLQQLRREQAYMVKTKNMFMNRLRSYVADALGYRPHFGEKERKTYFKMADQVISGVCRGDEHCHEIDGSVVSTVSLLIHNVMMSIKGPKESRRQPGVPKGIDGQLRTLERTMCRTVRELPQTIVEWAESVYGVGCGVIFAQIIGECGDLSNYATPAKVWKRMGAAPITKGDVTQMPHTWKVTKGLTSEDWSNFGDAKRRRPVVWNLGECIIKNNKGVYRQRYDDAKAQAAVSHPDWPAAHCHNHGRLLAAKLYLKDAWKAWN